MSFESALEFIMEPLPSAEELHVPGRLSPTSLPGPSTSTRFRVSSEELLSKFSVASVPKNTKQNTKWAVSSFREWMKHRNNIDRMEKLIYCRKSRFIEQMDQNFRN